MVRKIHVKNKVISRSHTTLWRSRKKKNSTVGINSIPSSWTVLNETQCTSVLDNFTSLNEGQTQSTSTLNHVNFTSVSEGQTQSTSALNSIYSTSAMNNFNLFNDAEIHRPLTDESSCHTLSENENIPAFLENLKKLVQRHNISNVFITSLLKILKEHPCFEAIPSDARTLLSTARECSAELSLMEPDGLYYHFGLETAIIECYTRLNLNIDHIKLSINIDGLPLTESTSSCFWPILGYITPFRNAVFLIGLYWGHEKPASANKFLSDFVKEAKYLEENGLSCRGKILKISVQNFLCDAVAKAFLLNIKGHGGYSSCVKCNCIGEYGVGRVYFPIKSCEKRTHQGFIDKIDPEHHLPGDITILSKLNIDIIEAFPFDYMHLILLGVVKKLLVLMIYKGPLYLRISKKKSEPNGCSKYDNICSAISNLQKSTPMEFSRKCRSLQEIARFKATELRQLLIYIGPVVFLNNIPDQVYKLFLTLSIGTFILLNPDCNNLQDLAHELLTRFVKDFSKEFGKHLISHNIHGLLHITDDFKRHGTLDSFSAFPFENFLFILKKKVRGPNKPLQQIIKRHSEGAFQVKKDDNSEYPILNRPHVKGPIPNYMLSTQIQYHECKLQNFTLRTKSQSIADCYCIFQPDSPGYPKVIEIHNFIRVGSSDVAIMGYEFDATYFFDTPLDSRDLLIFQLIRIIPIMKEYKLRDIKKKCFLVETTNQKVAMPLVHCQLDLLRL